MSPSVPAQKRWQQVFTHLVSCSPTALALAKEGEQNKLFKPLALHLEKCMSHLSKQSVESTALCAAMEQVIQLSSLKPALEGERLSQEVIVDTLINEYLTRLPWGKLSERIIATLWCRWCEVLSEGAAIDETELWVNIPSVNTEQWIDFEIETVLDESLTAYQEEGSEKKRIGLCFRGTGKSAQLAYARRWLLSRDCHLSFFNPYVSKTLRQILLVDDINSCGREGRWSLSEWLVSYQECPTLLIWSEHRQKNGFSTMLIESLDHYIEIDLDDKWQLFNERTHSHSAPAWLIADDPNLTAVDHLRCLAFEDKPVLSQVDHSVSDLEAFAALLGPLAPLKVLQAATRSREEVIRELLKVNGWIEVREDSYGGALFAPPSVSFWRKALIEGGQRAHQCAHILIDSIEQVYPPQVRYPLLNALQRLSRLRGREGYQGLIEIEVSLDRAKQALLHIQEVLTNKSFNPIGLSTLCGLGFDWAIRGPKQGRWTETLRALQVGVAAAERLRDPQMAGRLMQLLGKTALEDGRLEMASAALEAALKLLYATRLADEATQTARLLAESALLSGHLMNAHRHLLDAEKIAMALALPREAWHARFRAGQLYANDGEHTQALEIWFTLTQGQQEQTQALSESSALGTLFIEMAGSELQLGNLTRARFHLEHIEEGSLIRRVLWGICDSIEHGSDPSELLSEAFITSQKSREIGLWLALQNWRATLVLNDNIDHKDSELLSIEETRLGLELCVKVIVGTRDRLGLIKVYQKLADLYRHIDEQEAEIAALAMVQAWSNTMIRDASSTHKQRLKDRQKNMSTTLFDKTLLEADREVLQLIKLWENTPLSQGSPQQVLKH